MRTEVVITTYDCPAYLCRLGLLPGVIEIIDVTKPRIPPIAEIQCVVARHFNIRLEEMWSQRRSRMVARPRQIAMYLARELTGKSLPVIGRHFGQRDHTTVIHACRQVEMLCGTDRSIRAIVKEMRAELAA